MPFYVEPLFNVISIERIFDVIINRIYNKKLISTNLKKLTLKKLILDAQTNTASHWIMQLRTERFSQRGIIIGTCVV